MSISASADEPREGTVEADWVTLVTTDLPETWPAQVLNPLFLGEWCFKNIADSARWRAAGRVVPYHWNDRTQFRHDFDTLQHLNQTLVAALTPCLNDLHGLDHDERFWQRVVGFWINGYTTVLFDRWSMIERVAHHASRLESFVQPLSDADLAANDTSSFVLDSQICSRWNHRLFALLLARKPACRLHVIPAVGAHPRKTVATRPSRIKVLAKRFLIHAMRLKRHDKLAMTATYLPHSQQCLLDLRFGQVPGLLSFAPVPQVAHDPARRSWRLAAPVDADEFTRLAFEWLPRFMPRVFVEGFAALRSVARATAGPRSPKVIWTSNHHFSNDVFKLWAAEKCASGARLVIGEHGGLGTGAFNGSHSYELSIADRYLSTGWQCSDAPQVTPIGNFRQVTRQQSWQPDGLALLVCGLMTRFCGDMRSMMMSSQVLDYFEDQFAFVDALDDTARGALLVRLYGEDFNWQQVARWRARQPEVQIDTGHCSLWDLVARSRLFISTYNATTYVESMTLDVPTVMYWNPNHWELRPEAQAYFDRFEQVGIFHRTPQSAARHVGQIWRNVAEWWGSAPVRSARRDFLAHFSANPPDMLQRIERALRDEMRLARCGC